MVNQKNDEYYKNQALIHIEAIIEYTKDISYDEFIHSELLLDAVMFRFIQMIENIKLISDSFKNEHLEVPWGQIMGFRNGIVHNYSDTNYEFVFEIVKNDIFVLKEILST